MSSPTDPAIKLLHDSGVISQDDYPKVFSCLMYTMICTPSDITFIVRKFNKYTRNFEQVH